MGSRCHVLTPGSQPWIQAYMGTSKAKAKFVRVYSPCGLFLENYFLLQTKGFFISLVGSFELEVGVVDQTQLQPDLGETGILGLNLQQLHGALVIADGFCMLIGQARPVACLD